MKKKIVLGFLVLFLMCLCAGCGKKTLDYGVAEKGRLFSPYYRQMSINPLNWKTDGTPADLSLNHGAVFESGGEPIPELL